MKKPMQGSKRQAAIQVGTRIVDNLADGLLWGGQNRAIDKEDLVSVGMVEMLRTVDRNPPASEFPLEKRIVRNCRTLMLRYIRKEAKAHGDDGVRPIAEEPPQSTSPTITEDGTRHEVGSRFLLRTVHSGHGHAQLESKPSSPDVWRLSWAIGVCSQTIMRNPGARMWQTAGRGCGPDYDFLPVGPPEFYCPHVFECRLDSKPGWLPGYRTESGACLPVAPEWLLRMGYKLKFDIRRPSDKEAG